MPPLINFVSLGGPNLASYRMRILTPVRLLNSVFGGEAEVSSKANLNADVNVFSKHFEQKVTLENIRACKQHGSLSVFDICDDHFDREHGEFYKEAIELCDGVTCNSENMQERVYEVTGRLARIIGDPISFPEREARKASPFPLRVLWFGHASNLKGLVRWLPNIQKRITVITNVKVEHPLITSELWYPGLVESTIKDYDVVLLPGNDNPWGKCKSPNRAVDALMGGTLVITDDTVVYKDLLPFVKVVPKDGKGTQEIICGSISKEETKMIQDGQVFVKEKYSDRMVLEGWLKTLKDLGVICEGFNSSGLWA